MKRIFFICVLTLLILGRAEAASKATDVKAGNALYKEGDYASSLKKYEEALKKDPESDIINFNLGTAYYQQQEYDKAIFSLQKSLLTEDAALQQKAQYNIGNTLYKSGISKEDEDIDTAVSSLGKALTHYEQALKVEQKDEDSVYNYDFVKKELERLKKKQQEQEQKKQQQKQQKQKDKQQCSEDQNKQQESQGQQKQDEEEKQDQKKEKESQAQRQQQKEQEQKGAESREQSRAAQQKQQQGNTQGLQEMSKEEAEKLLREYQYSEEPQGLLNFMKRKGTESSVLKDW